MGRDKLRNGMAKAEAQARPRSLVPIEPSVNVEDG